MTRAFVRTAWIGIPAILLLALIHCSDDNGGPTPSDSGPSSDSTLWPCTEVDKACNAHDPCAIGAVCGKDHLCHPSFRQDCDDSLDCTTDTCGGPGLCVNTPKDGWCALPTKTGGVTETKCYQNGEANPSDPCEACDTTEPTKWSDASGATCDDENLCTKNDVCQDGVCQGTYYANECADGLACTDDICDGNGGCSKALQPGHCVIDNTCYKDGEKDAGGCAVCDSTKDAHAWTVLPNQCKIGGICFQPGATDTTGCGVCDPTKSVSAWSPAPNACLIQGACYASGATDTTGCGTCDPTKSTTAWTLSATVCLIQGACHQSGAKSPSGCGLCDPTKSSTTWTPVSGSTTQVVGFESGLGGFTVDAPVQGVGWAISQKRAKSGSASLRYGDPQAGDYDTGAANSGNATLAAVALPAGQKSALYFWLYLDTETSDGFDVLSVKVGTQVLWKKSATTVSTDSYRSWIPVEVDLSAFAGQSVSIVFNFDTKDAWSNSGEGVYLDDVTVVLGCL